jgi:hypothetical protein
LQAAAASVNSAILSPIRQRPRPRSSIACRISTDLGEQRLRFFEIGRVEAFGEPSEYRRQEIAAVGEAA